MENRFAVLAEAAGTVWHQALPLSRTNRLTQVGFARSTELTLAAFGGVQRNHMVAHLNTGDAFTDRFNNTATFVTQNRREDTFRIITRQSERVGMAYAGGDDLHTDLTCFRRCDLYFFNGQRLAGFPGNGSAAGNSLGHE